MAEELHSALICLDKLVISRENDDVGSKLLTTRHEDMLKKKLAMFSNCKLNANPEKATICLENLQCDNNWDVNWHYAHHCLAYLCNINCLLLKARKDSYKSKTVSIANETMPMPSLDMLSICQQKTVDMIVEFVVSFGITPYLLPSLGPSVKARMRYCSLIYEYEKTSFKLVKVEDMYDHLVYTTKHMLKLLDHESLATILLTRHIDSLLAALVQLGYAPLYKPNKQDDENKCYSMTNERYENLKSDQLYFRKEIENVLAQTVPSTITKSLLMLQSPGSTEVCVSKSTSKSINRRHNIRTPTWLQRTCGMLLSRQLVSNAHGIFHVIQGILDLSINARGGCIDNTQLSLHISHVISNPPISLEKYKDLKNYFVRVSPQLLELLNLHLSKASNQADMNNKHNKLHCKIIACCIQKLSVTSKVLARTYMLDIIMDPMLKLLQQNSLLRFSKSGNHIIVNEDEFEKCINELHFLFIVSSEPSSEFIQLLDKVVLALLHILCKICNGISHFRGKVEDLLESFLRNSENKKVTNVIYTFLSLVKNVNYECAETKVEVRRFNKDISIIYGDKGGILAVKNNGNSSAEFCITNEFEENTDVVSKLLVYEKQKTLSLHFYLKGVKDLADLAIAIQDEEICTSENGNGKTVESITQSQDQDISEKENLGYADSAPIIAKYIILSKVISKMHEDENLLNALMDDHNQITTILFSVIHRCAILSGVRCKHRVSSNTSSKLVLKQKNLVMEDFNDHWSEIISLETENLLAALTLLQHLIPGKCTKRSNFDTKTDWQGFEICVADLQILEEGHTKETVRELSKNLKDVILLRGAISPKKHTGDKEPEVEKVADINSKEISDLDSLQNKNNSKKKIHSNLSKLKKAYEDIQDNEVPVKGHGLITLTNLITSKNEETLKHLEEVIEIFRCHLKHDDTYIYIQSIKGLASCAFHNTSLVINILTNEYSTLRDLEMSKDVALQLYTKLGEALVKVTFVAGELTAAHSNKLLNPFLYVLRNNTQIPVDSMILASCLSNIAEICKNLQFSVTTNIQELFECIRGYLSHETLEVQRAALYLTSELFGGLKTIEFVNLEKDGLLTTLYKILLGMKRKKIKDDAAVIHLNSAIAKIDNFVRNSIESDELPYPNSFVLRM